MEGLVLKIFIVSILQCLQSNVGELFKLLILYWPGYLKASISLEKISWIPNMVFYLAMSGETFFRQERWLNKILRGKLEMTALYVFGKTNGWREWRGAYFHNTHR